MNINIESVSQSVSRANEYQYRVSQSVVRMNISIESVSQSVSQSVSRANEYQYRVSQSVVRMNISIKSVSQSSE